MNLTPGRTALHCFNTDLALYRSAIALLFVTAVVLCPSAQAHEFWLEPLRYELTTGDTLEADIRNGQDFVGTRFPYLPDNYQRFYITGPEGRNPVQGRLGDYPALSQTLSGTGLHTVVLESAENSLGYDTIEDFREFLGYHGLESVEAVHRRRDLPLREIREVYSRFAKSLIQVGSATHSPSIATGLLFEIDVLANPYLDSDVLPVAVLFKGQRLTAAQVEMFRRTDEGVSRQITTTRSNGIAELDISQPGDYLINAVQLIRPRQGREDVHWESLWASLTFRRD